MSGTKRVIRLSIKGKDVLFELSESTGTVSGEHSSNGRRFLSPTNVFDILWTEVQDGVLEFSYLDRSDKGKSNLVRLYAGIQDDSDLAREWCDAVMTAAYEGGKQRKNQLVLVNPKGGKGNAKSLYSNKTEPILRAARCTFETTFTGHSKHASEICQRLPLDTFDTVVVLSGDGLMHEVFNGFALHDQPDRAFATPVAPIPTGSANGTVINLLGLKEGFDVGVATLNSIKGRPMPHDLCSITLGDKRVYSFMTVALGLMADLDLGTEHMRWMGDNRFVYGFLRGLIRMKPCPITMSIKVAETDKDKMVEALRARVGTNHASGPSNASDNSHDSGSPLMDGTQEAGGWLEFDEPILFMYAGKSPYVGRDLMQFPVAQAADGRVDLVCSALTTRGNLLSSMDGAEKGKFFWDEFVYYYKAHAYRVEPKPSTSSPPETWNLAIDGERYTFTTPFEVEVLGGRATFLSPYGAFVDEFDPEAMKAERAKGQPKKEKGDHSTEGVLKGVLCCGSRS